MNVHSVTSLDTLRLTSKSKHIREKEQQKRKQDKATV